MSGSYCAYTNNGGRPENLDSFRCDAENGIFVVCDGLNGIPGGKVAAELCCEAAFVSLSCKNTPELAVFAASEALESAKASDPLLKTASCTICAAVIDGGECVYASLGDTRIYHFSGGDLKETSADDSVSYGKYAAGKCAYADIRFSDERSVLLRSLGDGRTPMAHTGRMALADSDGILICTDGFWQYVFETEMAIDLQKSDTADEWLMLMLLRLAHRSLFDGDNLTAVAYIQNGGK